MSQVTTSDRRYDLYFAEDIQSETYPLIDSVERTAETDAVVNAYFAARLNLYTKLQPGRMLPEASLTYRGTESVAEVTTEYARLYPTSQP